MYDYLIQIILMLVGALIGVIATRVSDKKQKIIAWLISISLIFVGGALIGYSLLATPETSDTSLTVHVADKSGMPVSNAKALVFYSDGSFSQYTDSNGIITFTLPTSEKSYRLIIEADEFQIFERELQPKKEGRVDIRLEEQQGDARKIILRTVSEADRAPIPDVETSLVVQGEIYRDVTDSDGFAQFDLIFPNTGKLDAQISVSKEGYDIENQTSTLLPGKLQYILLQPNDLQVEIPNIPEYEASSESQSASTPAGNVEPGSGVERTEESGSTGLRVIVLGSEGQPWEGTYISVFNQVADASGNPSTGDRVAEGHINHQGLLDFQLPAGMYVVCSNNAPGYTWTEGDCIVDISVKLNTLSKLKLQVGRMEVAIVGPTGDPWVNVYYQIFTQKPDAMGNPVIDKRAVEGHTSNSGLGGAWLTPGMYSLLIDLPGYNWANSNEAKGKINIPISSGNVTRELIKMGALQIGLITPEGEPNKGVYVQVFLQSADLNGKPILSDRIWEGHTTEAGTAILSLTQGNYALKMGDQVLFDIPITWGMTTETDGITFTQK